MGKLYFARSREIAARELDGEVDDHVDAQLEVCSI